MNAPQRARPETWQLETGAVLGGWRVTGTLAKGGMGELYLAERIHGRSPPAALKILLTRKGRATDEKMLKRFLQEADILSKIRHPNVVQFFDAGTSDAGEPFMVTELLEGATLLELVEREGRMGVPEVLDVCAETADGVHAGHELGVLHRDLKPANVFVTRQGAVKVIDFGIAKPFEGDMVAGKIAPSTEHGMIIGTWNYLSPEQLLGKKRLIDRGSDIFALGTVAYELIAGASPWADEDGALPTRDAVATRIVMVDPEPLTARFHGFPDEVWHVLRTALSKAPKDRFANMAVFAERLRRARAQYLASRGLPQGGLQSMSAASVSKHTPKRGGTLRALEAVPPLESRIVSPLAPPTKPSASSLGPKGTIPMGHEARTPTPAARVSTERGPVRASLPVAPTELERAPELRTAAPTSSTLALVVMIGSATAVVLAGLMAMKTAGVLDPKAEDAPPSTLASTPRLSVVASPPDAAATAAAASPSAKALAAPTPSAAAAVATASATRPLAPAPQAAARTAAAPTPSTPAPAPSPTSTGAKPYFN